MNNMSFSIDKRICRGAAVAMVLGAMLTAPGAAFSQAPKDICTFNDASTDNRVEGELLYSPNTNLVYSRLKLHFRDFPISNASRTFTEKLVYKAAWIERDHHFKTGKVTEKLKLALSYSLSDHSLVSRCDFYVGDERVGVSNDLANIINLASEYSNTECSIDIAKFAGKFPAKRFANDPLPTISVRLIRYKPRPAFSTEELQKIDVGSLSLVLDFDTQTLGAMEKNRETMYERFRSGQCRPVSDGKTSTCLFTPQNDC